MWRIDVATTSAYRNRNSLKNGQMEVHASFLWGSLQLDDSTLYTYCNGMCPVIGPEFGKYIDDMALYAGFSDRKLIGDLFVGASLGNQP